MTRAIIYARVSSQDKTGSTREQIDMCTAYCNERNYQIVKTIAEDESSYTGGQYIDLPGITEVIELAYDHSYDVLVVKEMDRLARDLAKQLTVENMLKSNGVQIEYVLADYEDSLEGQLTKNVRAVIAEYERGKITERLNFGKYRALRNGSLMLSGTRPYGYDVIKQDGITTLAINESEADIVRLIFHLYANEKLSMYKVAKRLTELGYPTMVDTDGKNNISTKKRPYGHWDAGSIRNILNREMYATGVWEYGKIKKITIEGLPTIISQDLFDKAQIQRKKNKAFSKRNKKHEYLISGHVTCSKCENRMIGTRHRAYGKDYFYYKCPAIKPDRYATRCENKHSFIAHKMDSTVWDWVIKLFSDPQYLDEKTLEILNEDNKNLAPLQRQLDTTNELLNRETNKLTKRMKLVDNLTNETAITTLSNEIDEIGTVVNKLEAQKYELEKKIASQRRLSHKEIKSIQQLSSKLSNKIKLVTEYDDKRKLLDMLNLEAILIYDYENKKSYIGVTCVMGTELLCVDGTHSGYNKHNTQNFYIIINETLAV